MTQILSCLTPEGIMVATDGVATIIAAGGERRYFQLHKLYGLSSHAFIVSGGMGCSVELSLDFRDYVRTRGLVGIEDIVAAAGPFLRERARPFLQDVARQTEEESSRVQQLYLLVGGLSFASWEQPFQLALWGSTGSGRPLQRLRIANVAVIPRSLRAEMRLQQLCTQEDPLAKAHAFALSFLRQCAKVDDEVGPPFVVGTVTRGGFNCTEFD